MVDRKRIEELPLNGRMTFRLVQLTPGVSTPSGSSGVGANGDSVPLLHGLLGHTITAWSTPIFNIHCGFARFLLVAASFLALAVKQ